MASVIAVFDDQRDLEKATTRLAEAGLDAWVIDEIGELDEQPLPPELGGASQVPLATPHAITTHENLVAGGGAGRMPRGPHAPALEDLVHETGMDDEVAERYRRIVASGGSLVVVRGDRDDVLSRAQAILEVSGSTSVAGFGRRRHRG